MKKLLVLLFALVTLQLGFATDTRAQRIDFKKLGLMRPDYERNTRLYFGDTKDKALTVLGNPTRTGTHWSEIDEKTVEEWYYGTSKLNFLDGRLDDYELKDRSLLVGESFSTSFGIGSLMGTKVMPTSPKLPDDVITVDWFYGYNITKLPGTSRNIPYHIISINYLVVNSVNYDSAFEVLFDSSKRIINIRLGD